MKTRPHAVISMILAVSLVLLSGCGPVVITDSDGPEQYGIFPEDKNTEKAQEVFDALFPATLQPEFEDVAYHYRSVDGADAYSFEIELSFQVPDEDVFQRLAREYLAYDLVLPFYADSDYLICFQDSPDLDYESVEKDGGPCQFYACRNLDEHWHFGYSRIHAVLVNQKEHRFYFLALDVFDGGGVNTLTLNRFFTDFNLNPKELEDFIEPYIVEIIPD